ncbi:glycoside hydrolase superfamily [Chytriomyces sp. MP71]|nr:glycoside hydrolase superfamily [Chytriomyces sp. MP71]
MKTATIFAAVASAVSAKAVGDASLYLWPQPVSVVDGGAAAVLSSVCVDKSIIAAGVDITPFYTSYLAKTGNKLADAYGCPEAPQPHYVPPQPTCASPDNIKKSYKRDVTPFSISVSVKTTLTDAAQLAGVDESYTLKVTASGATITANTNVGANYAVRTLSQLITNGGEIITATIQDEPAYPYRGFMLDTSRNFFPVEDIKRIIDGLAASKLNVFHWHIYDSQSFPIKWDKYSKLDNAKYKNDDGSLKQYTKDDVTGIVDYAFKRGVRVIPEFELPGHNAVFGEIDPSLVKGWKHSPWDATSYAANAQCNNASVGFLNHSLPNINPNSTDGPCFGVVWWGRHYCNQPPCGQLDISSPAAIQIVDDLITEVGSWFKDPVIHVGHDEVNARAYGLVPETWDHPDPNALTSILPGFERQLVAILAKNNKKYAAWDEVAWDNQPLAPDANALNYGVKDIIPKDAIINVWDQFYMGPWLYQKIVDNGFKNIVASPNAFWYLDCSPSVKWCRNQLGPGAATFFDVTGKPAPQLTPDTTYENQAAFGGKGLNETGFWHTGGQWHNWTLIYNYDPRQGLPDNTASAIKGGFGSLWSETIKRHNLDSHTFPRVSAIAERLWSDIDLNSHTAYRFDRFRASLVNELGIAAADIDYLGNQELFTFRPEWCDTNIATAAQKTIECCFPGQPLTDQSGGELVAPYGSHFTSPSDYCKIATLYKTNSFTYTKPAAVPYAF